MTEEPKKIKKNQTPFERFQILAQRIVVAPKKRNDKLERGKQVDNNH